MGIVEQIKEREKLSVDCLHREHDYGADVQYIADTLTSASYGFIHAATVYGTHCLVLRGAGEFSTKPEKYCFGMADRKHILKNSAEGMKYYTSTAHMGRDVVIHHYDSLNERLQEIDAKTCAEILDQWKNTVLSKWK